MVMLLPYRRARYLYLGGPVETARSRARVLALVATLIYAACLFGLVMLAHVLLDHEPTAARSAEPAALQEPSHRL